MFGLTDGGGGYRLIICYCPLMSLQVFIQDITDTKILTVTHVHVCVPFCALLYNPGCKWSLLEQGMRPLPSISLIKSKLLPLFLSLFPLSHSLTDFIFCSFCPFSQRVKRAMCHYHSTQSLTAHAVVVRVDVGHLDTLNVPRTCLLA